MDLSSISDSWTQRQYNARQIIIYAGDEVNQLFYIKSGYLKVYTIPEDSDERILLILKPGDIFPLLKDPEQSGAASLYFYESMTDLAARASGHQELLAKLRGDPQAAWELLKYTSEFSSILTGRLAQLESKKAKDKLESLFDYLISVCGKTKAGGSLLDLKLTHHDIAGLINLSRETVSVEMKRLEKQGVIAYKKGFLLIKNQPESAGK
jgi:CRP/FNR family cyclic AMP-dependent transcriptional regulator